MNLAGGLLHSATRDPERTALTLDEMRLTYAMLDEASAQVAALLRARGLEPGDRVGLMLPNVPEFPIVYYGILRAGGVVVPMNVLFKEREAAFQLGDAEARLVFAWDGAQEAAQAGAAKAGAECVSLAPGTLGPLLSGVAPLPGLVERDDSDTAVILYTSAMAGTPVAAELTHANLRRNVEAMLPLLGIHSDSVVLGALPLFHAFGQTCTLNMTMTAGACLTLLPRFRPGKALQVMQRDRVTVFFGVPTMYSALLAHPDFERFDLSALDLCVSGGAALPVDLLLRAEAALGRPVLEGYGLSEASPVASVSRRDHPRKPGSIGLPIDGVEMGVVDGSGRALAPGEAGEIVIRGHNVMKGYWKRPDATADAVRDGWLHTGDVAVVDDEGFFFIVGRTKNMIIRAGLNVYPREVEDVLLEHPAVREAAVVGVPDEHLGEEVEAAVLLEQGARAMPLDLRDHVKHRLAAYKYPREIRVVDELPGPAPLWSRSWSVVRNEGAVVVEVDQD